MNLEQAKAYYDSEMNRIFGDLYGINNEQKKADNSRIDSYLRADNISPEEKRDRAALSYLKTILTPEAFKREFDSYVAESTTKNDARLDSPHSSDPYHREGIKGILKQRFPNLAKQIDASATDSPYLIGLMDVYQKC